MQQRRPRLGDILDDYCPRERRITNHAVVAMIDDEVKQTRCTTCDADHEYRQAKAPPPRRKKTDGALADAEAVEGNLRAKLPADDSGAGEDDIQDGRVAPETLEDEPPAPADPSALLSAEAAEEAPVEDRAVDDEGPVHRRLIRATLPRPEGHVPERKEPDLTMRQPGGRGGRDFDGNRNGHRHGRRFGPGPGQRQGGGGQGHGQRQGAGHGHRDGSGQGQRPAGNRSGHGRRPAGQGGRGGRPGTGSGPGPGRGSGRKRGR